MIWNLCIERPVLTVVIFLVVTIFGVYGYMNMPVREFPDVDFPVVNVSVVLPGADPEVIETEVVEPLEENLNTIEGVDKITSTSREQVGQVTVEFDLYRDINLAAQDVRAGVDRALPEMPDDVESPIVQKIDPDAQAIMWIAVTGNERWDKVRLTRLAENRIKERLERLAGVGQILVGGERRYAVRIQLDPQRLAAHRLTVRDVVDAIRANNVDIPSGRIESRTREFLVKTRGQFSSAEPFNRIVVASRGDATIRLEDVGRAVDGVENERQAGRFMGEPAVGLGVVKQADVNMVALADRIKKRLTEIEETLPPGVQYRINSDSSKFPRQQINDLLFTILLATVMVVIVIYFFLGEMSGTLIAGLAIPSSLLTGTALINWMGFSLNMLSMLGFILVIGIVVDDAVVVLESCFRHLEAGAEPRPAARTGTTEIAFAAIANSLSLGAVFIPVALMPGMIGRFFLEFGLTVAVTVFASTFVALTLTPMLIARWGRPPPEDPAWPVERFQAGFSRLKTAYGRLLRAALDHPWVTVGVAAASLLVALGLLSDLDSEMTPPIDREQFIVSFETAEGSTLEYTDRYARKIEAILKDLPEVRSFFLGLGLSRAGPGQVNEGIAFVDMVPVDERSRSQQAVQQAVRKKLRSIPGVRGFVIAQAGPGGQQSPLEIVLAHPDLEALAKQQREIMNWMRAQDEYTGVNTNMKLNKPQVDVRIRRDKASQMGVSVAQISRSLRFVFGEPDIGNIDRGGERYDVLTEINRKENVPSTILQLYTRNREGRMISLSNLVELRETIGPSEIHHYNRGRSATISAQLPPGVALGTALNKVERRLAETLPGDFEVDVTGQAERFRESFYYLTMALVFSVVFIYLVLAGQYESFLTPFVILMTLPLAGVGAFGGLWAAGMTMNIFSFIGLIMLLGMVTKNGILLVDYADVLKARGRSLVDAAREAGEVRFRPVLMTAISTIVGLMPIALGYGMGGGARAPMGVAITVGMFGATALTLVVIPVIYTLMHRLSEYLLDLRDRTFDRTFSGEGGASGG